MKTKTQYVLVLMTQTEAEALASSPIPRGEFKDGATRKRALAGLEKVRSAPTVTADVTTAKRAIAKLSGL